MKNKIKANINYTDNKLKEDVTKGSDIIKLYKEKGIELDNDRIEILKRGNETSNGVPFIVLVPAESDDVDYIEVIGDEEKKEELPANHTGEEETFIEEDNKPEEVLVADKVIVNEDAKLTDEEIADLKEDEVIEVITNEVEEAIEKPKRKKTSKEQ